MARTVLPIVGAAIGAYFGGPQGAQIGFAIGSFVGNAVDPLVIDGPKIGDIAAQTSSEGVYQPIYFGTAQGAGNVIDQGPNIIRKKEQEQGKGGGPVTVTESLYKTFAIRIGVSWLGEAGIVGIARIWENGKLVFDIREGSTIISESAKFAGKFRLYRGTEDQPPDPDLEAIHGVGNTPNYRGRAYVVFPLYDITQWRAIPQYTFEVVTGGTATPPIQMVALAAAGWITSPDGTDWSAPSVPDSALSNNRAYILATDETFIAHALTGNHPAYIEVGDTSWSYSTGAEVSSSGGAKWGAFNPNSTVGLIPDGLGGNCIRTLDKGRTWTRLSGTNAMQGIAAYNFKFYGIRNTGVFETLDDGATWHLDDDGPVNTASGFARASGISLCAFGGRHPVINIPALMVNETGLDWVKLNLYGMTNSNTVAAMCTGRVGGGVLETLVMAGNGGDIAVYRRGAGLQYSPQVFPSTPNDLAWNGQVFVLIGGEQGETGRIWTSYDGITWTERRTGAVASSLNAWTSVAALALSGGTISSDPPTLDEVVSAIHTWCDQPESEFDVGELSETLVRGWILAGPYLGKDCINSMQGLWQFDSPEYDKRIHYRMRGKPVVRVFDFDDLVDEPEEATREQAIEYPRKAHLDYQSPAVDYAPAKATSARSSQDARVVGEANVQVSVVLTPDEAAQRITVMHKVFWADADGEVIFSVSDQNLDLAPGDCIGLSLRGTIRRLRIVKMEIADGVIKLTCRYDRQSAYTSDVTGIEPPPPTPPPPSLVGPPEFIVGDWPALRDEDDRSTPVKYLAVGQTSPAWSGAQVDVSTDGGNSYTYLRDVITSAIMGTLQEEVADAAPYFTDHTNKVIVQLDIDDGSVELDSLTQTQFLSEQGGFALVKADGSFELMQYRDSVDLGDGIFELSYLQRGRLDSETHAFTAGDRFILLTSVAVATAPTFHIGLDIYHRATTYGTTTEEGTVVNDVYEARSQIEWPVAHLFVEESSGTITGSIVPRHRFGTDANPIRSINWTGYQIQVQDSLDQIDTFIQTGDDFTYDASAMTFPVKVSVAQVNRLTGAGPSVSEVIP